MREPGGLCCTLRVKRSSCDVTPALFPIVCGSWDSALLGLPDLGMLATGTGGFTPSCWSVGHALNQDSKDDVCEQGQAAILSLQFV